MHSFQKYKNDRFHDTGKNTNKKKHEEECNLQSEYAHFNNTRHCCPNRQIKYDSKCKNFGNIIQNFKKHLRSQKVCVSPEIK